MRLEFVAIRFRSPTASRRTSESNATCLRGIIFASLRMATEKHGIFTNIVRIVRVVPWPFTRLEAKSKCHLPRGQEDY